MASCALSFALVIGCGGSTSRGGDGQPNEGGSMSQPGPGGASFGGASGRAGSPAAGSSGSRNLGGGAGSEPDPVGPGCKPEDLPPPELECDPFGPNTCGPGAGCYPFVEHPEGGDCGSQRYGAHCLLSGSGMQGDLCGEESGDYCAEGHVCVVGQRAGKRCAALCKPGVPNQCAGGLVCGDLDVAGFGVCG